MIYASAVYIIEIANFDLGGSKYPISLFVIGKSNVCKCFYEYYSILHPRMAH